jgi:diadenosine tetraphosphatase ApaH/serine/threonine PP2A family protein phosphatase
MQLLIISDIHANLAAFEAVLADAAGEFDKIWCLGDLVGYGPEPNECVALLRNYDHISLSGNHDWAVLGKLAIEDFNPEAQKAIRWTSKALHEDARRYLDALPTMRVEEPFTLAHASPRQPIWEYILDVGTAAANFRHFDTPYCLVGHSHTPLIFVQVDPKHADGFSPIYHQPYLLDDGRYIFNPGSVGQPRDSDERAAYALLNLDELAWEFRRVEYDIARTQEKMRRVGMPSRLVARLEYGW